MLISGGDLLLGRDPGVEKHCSSDTSLLSYVSRHRVGVTLVIEFDSGHITRPESHQIIELV